MLRSGFRSKFAIAVHCLGYEIDHDVKNRFIFTKLLQSVVMVGRYLSVVISKVRIDECLRLNKKLWLSSRGNIILGAHDIGENCIIHHNVTLGMGLGSKGQRLGPIIGSDVWIGPNSIIHGNLHVGDGVTILGGTVLSRSIPSRCVVGGNPVKIICKNFDNKKILQTTNYTINDNILEF